MKKNTLLAIFATQIIHLPSAFGGITGAGDPLLPLAAVNPDNALQQQTEATLQQQQVAPIDPLLAWMLAIPVDGESTTSVTTQASAATTSPSASSPAPTSSSIAQTTTAPAAITTSTSSSSSAATSAPEADSPSWWASLSSYLTSWFSSQPTASTSQNNAWVSVFSEGDQDHQVSTSDEDNDGTTTTAEPATTTAEIPTIIVTEPTTPTEPAITATAAETPATAQDAFYARLISAMTTVEDILHSFKIPLDWNDREVRLFYSKLIVYGQAPWELAFLVSFDSHSGDDASMAELLASLAEWREKFLGKQITSGQEEISLTAEQEIVEIIVLEIRRILGVLSPTCDLTNAALRSFILNIIKNREILITPELIKFLEANKITPANFERKIKRSKIIQTQIPSLPEAQEEAELEELLKQKLSNAQIKYLLQYDGRPTDRVGVTVTDAKLAELLDDPELKQALLEDEQNEQGWQTVTKKKRKKSRKED